MTDTQAKAQWTGKAQYFVKPIVVGRVPGFGVCSKTSDLVIPFGTHQLALEVCWELICGGMTADGFTFVHDDGTPG